jgi:ATP-dependent RNA helicase DDX5/DBP2
LRSLLPQPYLKPGEGPIVLVLAPTRELAVQIKEECDKFGASSEIKNTVVYGGVPKQKQVRDLRSGVEIVIATPVSFFFAVHILKLWTGLTFY